MALEMAGVHALQPVQAADLADAYAAGHAAGFADALVLGALSVTCWECGDPICAESTRCAHCTWCDSPGAEE
jgi:hypothetical protein